MKRTASILVTLIMVAISSVALLAQPANALGWGEECNKGRAQSQTNDWRAYWSKKLRAETRVCHRIGAEGVQNFPAFSYIARPTISVVDVPLLPSAERVSVSDLSLYDYTTRNGWIISATWRFTSKSCIAICTTIRRSYTVEQYGTRLCAVGGACDTWKRW